MASRNHALHALSHQYVPANAGKLYGDRFTELGQSKRAQAEADIRALKSASGGFPALFGICPVMPLQKLEGLLVELLNLLVDRRVRAAFKNQQL